MTKPFKFKGDRQYVQGPDMFNYLLDSFDHLNSSITLDFSIHHITNKQMVIMERSAATDQEKIIAHFKLADDKKEIHKILYETGDLVDSSFPYDEEKILEQARWQDGRLELPCGGDNISVTFMEQIVSLNKRFLLSTFPGLKGKWYFVRFKAAEVSADIFKGKNTTIAVQFKRQIKNYALTESLVFADDHIIGQIYFSLK